MLGAEDTYYMYAYDLEDKDTCEGDILQSFPML